MVILSKAYYKEKGGQLVTPSQYEAYNRANSIEYLALCICCNEPLFSYGVNSPNVTECFKHHKTQDIIHKCPLHSSSARNGFLDRIPLDIENGILLRNEFFRKDNLLNAYELCHKMKGGRTGCLSQDEFITIVESADATGIWNYKGIKLWGIMIILLLKTNYSFKSSGTRYYYKFKRRKIRRNCLENGWWNDVILQPCFLEDSKDIDEKYKASIPFSEIWYQEQVSKRHFKEDYVKVIFSYFKT